MAVLITGSEGFLGLRVAQLLRSAGKEVVGLDVAAGETARPWPVLVGDNRRTHPTRISEWRKSLK